MNANYICEDEVPAVQILVMGPTGAGKSSFINAIVDASQANEAGQISNSRVGHGLQSCTVSITGVPAHVDGQECILVDTPGYDDTTRSDAEILRETADFLMRGQRVAGILYLHRITDNRVGGVSAKNMRMFRTLCGDDALRNVVLCRSMWDKVCWSASEEKTAVAREEELRADFWAPMLAQGSSVSRFENPRESALGLTELADGIPLDETESGKLVSGDLKKLEEKHQREMEILRRDMALKHGQALAQLKKEFDEEMASAPRAREDQEKLGKKRDEEIKQLRAELKKSRDCC